MNIKSIGMGVATCLSFWASAGGVANALDVFFDRMHINDCKEFGTCDWSLSCALGTASVQRTTLIIDAEANTDDDLQIDQFLTTTGTFPVTVTCNVLEFDAGIGAAWEEVGLTQIRVTEPGNFRLHAANSEGDVDILIEIGDEFAAPTDEAEAEPQRENEPEDE